MNPACATLEYASIRFTSVCAIASSDPTTIETADSTQMNGVQSHASGLNAVSNTRISAANAATFVAADMDAVTGGGAPWSATGAHTATAATASRMSRAITENLSAATMLPRTVIGPCRPHRARLAAAAPAMPA